MEKTSTEHSPWHLIPANHKNYARLAVFTILTARLGKDVDTEPKPLDPKTAEAARGLFRAQTQRPRIDPRPVRLAVAAADAPINAR